MRMDVQVGALFTTVSSIRVSRDGRVSRVSVMVSVRDSVKCAWIISCN